VNTQSCVGLLCIVLLCMSCQPEDKKDTKSNTASVMKIAIISSRDVLTRCDAGARIVSEIQGKFSDQRIDLGLLEQDIRKLQDDVKSPTDKNPKAALLQDKLQAYAEAERKLRQAVVQEESVRFKPIADEINKVLDIYAKEKHLSGIQERGMYVYYDRSLDITEEIIKRVNLTTGNF
jgi:outer membrane protein